MRNTSRKSHLLTLVLVAVPWMLSASLADAEQQTARDIFYQQGGSQPGAIPGAAAPATSIRPAIKFWLEREKSDGRRDLVLGSNEKDVFRSGDKVWFLFETNFPAHAYLVNKGSSNRIQMLLPGMGGEQNAVKPRRRVTVPQVKVPFMFDKTPGTEQIRLVLWSKPIPELEQMSRRSARALSMDSAPYTLTEEETKVWKRVVDKGLEVAISPEKGVTKRGEGSKDLVLDQVNQADTFGNYVAGPGFEKPIVVRMNLKHVR